MKTINRKEIIIRYTEQLLQQNIIPEILVPKAFLLEASGNEKLIFQGENGTSLYFLIDGHAEVRSILNNGSILTISRIHSPCLIGEMELIDPESETMEVLIADKSLIFRWNLDDVKDILLNDVNFLRYLAYSISKKERQSIRQMARERGMDAKGRLALFIRDNSENGIFSIRKTIVSEMLGISYRHTEKLFSDLCNDKTIKKEGLKYIITDIKTLKSLINED